MKVDNNRVILGDGDIGLIVGRANDDNLKVLFISKLLKTYKPWDKVPLDATDEILFSIKFKSDDDINNLIDSLQKLKKR